MKQLCLHCNHVCHCPGKGTTGECPSCKCKKCIHDIIVLAEEVKPMWKKLWKKIVDWMWR